MLRDQTRGSFYMEDVNFGLSYVEDEIHEQRLIEAGRTNANPNAERPLH